MKLLIVLSAVVGLVAAGKDLSYYVTQDDYVDVDAVIADLSQLREYCDCFLDKGPCNPLAKSFKDVIQDSVIHACNRCSVPQKEQYGRFLIGLKRRLPECYVNFRHKYDPKNIYFNALEAELCKFWNYKVRSKPTSKLIAKIQKASKKSNA